MKFKKLIALGIISSMALSVNAIANENGTITVNGEAVNGSCYSENDVTFVSLRSVAEALGFEVNWDGENKSIVLSDTPRYVTMSIGNDGYTFSKTAPMPLGAAPVIKDSTTFVPTTLFSDLLDYDVEIENDNVAINDKISFTEEVSVTSVSDDTITINSETHGEVILSVGKTMIYNADGTLALASEISEGDIIEVEYSAAMTMSIPPHNNPIKITIISKAETETTTEETTSIDEETSTVATTEVVSEETSAETTTEEETETTTEEA
ncbi:MAG: copper amine oxidase N-terminal domain-containing protein [Lachnospirales bacterium]